MRTAYSRCGRVGLVASDIGRASIPSSVFSWRNVNWVGRNVKAWGFSSSIARVLGVSQRDSTTRVRNPRGSPATFGPRLEPGTRWPYFVTWNGRETSPRGRDITSNRSWNDERTDDLKNSDPAGAFGGTFKSTRCVPSNPAHGKRRESRGEGHREDGGLQRRSVRLRDHVARSKSSRPVLPRRHVVGGADQGGAVLLRHGDEFHHDPRHVAQPPQHVQSHRPSRSPPHAKERDPSPLRRPDALHDLDCGGPHD